MCFSILMRKISVCLTVFVHFSLIAYGQHESAESFDNNIDIANLHTAAKIEQKFNSYKSTHPELKNYLLRNISLHISSQINESKNLLNWAINKIGHKDLKEIVEALAKFEANIKASNFNLILKLYNSLDEYKITYGASPFKLAKYRARFTKILSAAENERARLLNR